MAISGVTVIGYASYQAVHGELNGNTYVLPPNTQIITLTKPGDILYVNKMTFDIVNITGNSDLNNKIIRGYIEALDLVSESKIDLHSEININLQNRSLSFLSNLVSSHQNSNSPPSIWSKSQVSSQIEIFLLQNLDFH